MLTESDLVEIMGYYHAGDNSKLLDAFQRFDLHDWVTECNEWKRKHAQEFSDFLQHVISILPSEYTSMGDVLTLCENYARALAYLPAAPDCAAQTIVKFWNRKRLGEEESMVIYFSLLMRKLDSACIAENAKNAVDIADRINEKHQWRLIVLPHIEEVKECFRAGDDAKLLDAFQRLIALGDWYGSFYGWGEENAEECSAFVQRIVPLLPPSTPMDVVIALCDNYLLELVCLPHAIDISVKLFVDFWNRKRAVEDREAIELLSALSAHPDGDHAAEIAQSAVGIGDKLNG